MIPLWPISLPSSSPLSSLKFINLLIQGTKLRALHTFSYFINIPGISVEEALLHCGSKYGPWTLNTKIFQVLFLDGKEIYTSPNSWISYEKHFGKCWKFMDILGASRA